MKKTRAPKNLPSPANSARPTAAPSPRIALYAGTFDPMTLGHLDVVVRARNLFDQVIVGVGQSGKQPLFSTEERVRMIEEACANFSNIKVISFSGLTVDFAKRHGITCLVRGLRNEVDFSYELQMAHMNRTLERLVETVFIPTSQEYGHISSTLVREIARFGREVGKLVPPSVFKELSEKFPI